MKIIILGGNGYIGSKLFLQLQKLHKVSTVDLEWFGRTNPENYKMDYRHLGTSFVQEFDAVILLAAHSSVPMCKDDMLSSFRNNVVNFVELLGKMKLRQKFIYASSSSIYGNTASVAANECWPEFDPKTYYDLGKQEIDCYAKLSNIEYYALRFGTVNGASPNLRTDIMINKMYETAIQSGKIEVFNKNTYRPILGISDLCRAVECILHGGDNRGVYNLASFNASVGEIASEIKNILPEIEIEDKGFTQTYNFSIDVSKFKKTYDFEFNESVSTIVKSLKDNWDTMNKSVRLGREYV